MHKARQLHGDVGVAVLGIRLHDKLHDKSGEKVLLVRSDGVFAQNGRLDCTINCTINLAGKCLWGPPNAVFAQNGRLDCTINCTINRGLNWRMWWLQIFRSCFSWALPIN